VDGLLEHHGVVQENDTMPSLDLNSLGYDKLLGGGRIRGRVTLHIGSATDSAKEKVEAAGGEVLTSHEHNTKR
jgi:large subunit ribosomal protein L15